MKWDQGIKTWDRLETCNFWSSISYVQRSLHQQTGAKAGVIYFVSLVVDIFLSAFSIELFGNLNETSNLATTVPFSRSWTSCPNSRPLVSLYQICKDAKRLSIIATSSTIWFSLLNRKSQIWNLADMETNRALYSIKFLSRNIIFLLLPFWQWPFGKFAD